MDVWSNYGGTAAHVNPVDFVNGWAPALSQLRTIAIEIMITAVP